MSLHEVDHIAIGRDPYAKLGKKLLFLLKNPGGGFRAVRDRLSNAKKVSSLESEFINLDATQDEKA